MPNLKARPVVNQSIVVAKSVVLKTTIDPLTKGIKFHVTKR